MKKNSLILTTMLSVASIMSVNATDVKVERFIHAGPFGINKPIIADSLNVNGAAFQPSSMLKNTVDYDKLLSGGSVVNADTAGYVNVDKPSSGYSLNLYSFYIDADRFVKGSLEVEGKGMYEVLVGNNSVGSTSQQTFEPYKYKVTVKYLSCGTDTIDNKFKVTFKPNDNSAVVTASINPERFYTPKDILNGTQIRGAYVSPDGKYVIVRYNTRFDGGKEYQYAQLRDTRTGEVIYQDAGNLTWASWLPSTSKLYFTRDGANGKELIYLDPTTLQQEVAASNLPDGYFYIAPDEQTLIFSIVEKGPAENGNMLRVLEPEDRIQGFRDRYQLWKYEMSTGIYQQLTFGSTSMSLNDISSDSRYILVSTYDTDYTKLPFFKSSLYKIDLQTYQTDTIWYDAPYLSSALFSPDGKKLLVLGSANAFDNVGLNLKDGGEIANSYDVQAFIYDPATRKADPITKNFNPCVMSAEWSKYDNNIYIKAEDQDCRNIYMYNTAKQTMKKLNVDEDVLYGFSIANTSPMMYYYGQSAANSTRLYSYDVKTDKSKLVYDLSAERLKDIKLGQVTNWNYIAPDGTSIQGRFYLPPNFDSTKKYPLIVYYYGGTSPTARSLDYAYSMQMFAALGYVVYTLNPSGATGFGQDFAARHINAWGDRTADEIIEGTKQFCREHSYVNSTKIGCIGASYGGFMTQYLQTKTDMFAAAVSHAGISAISSYWGEGYSGYGYSAVASYNTYPWTNPEFFTKHSPLFNADKIKTPLLLLHGNADTNVPIGESIQMFLALKLLGKPVEFVQVKGENHIISDYTKQLDWQRTIIAWFARWLKDEPQWWNNLYPERDL